MLGEAAVAPEALRTVQADHRGHNYEAFLHCVRNTLARRAHVFQVDNPAYAALASGFILALLCTLKTKSQVLWVSQRLAALETGTIYGPGLQDMGIAPGDIIFVEAASSSDVLWAVEEGLSSSAIGGVVGEFAVETRHLDLTATRRLALRSNEARIPTYLSIAARDVGATAARSRWRVASAPSRPGTGSALLGDPTWTLDCLKNREGPCGRVVVGYSPQAKAFFPAGEERRTRRTRATFAAQSKAGGDVASLVVPFATRLQSEDADRR